MDRLQLSLVPLLGRILMAYIFITSGFGKLMNPAGAIGYIASAGLPLPQVAVYVAVVVELIGGIALVVGFQTRLVALVMAVFTLVTAFAFHNHMEDMGQAINFMKNIAITGGFLQVVAFGAGAWSLDAMMNRPRAYA